MSRKRAIFGAVILAFLLAGCAKPFFVACREVAGDEKGEFKYSEPQVGVACERAQFYVKNSPVEKDEETKKWKLNPSKLPASEVKKVFKDQAGSLDAFLTYENREDADWIDWFKGFREGLEKQEKIVLEILRRLNYVDSFNEFTDAVGDLPAEMRSESSNYFFSEGRKSYSLRHLYSEKPIEDIPFTAEYVEVAMREGKFKLVDTFRLNTYQEFSKKIPDLYDPNEFRWESQERGWLVNAYKILSDKEKPIGKSVHYIEVFRIDGTEIEDLPAVRGFLPSGGSGVSVFVVDYDQKGHSGYGSPDKVIKSFTEAKDAQSIFTDNYFRSELLEKIYENPEDNNRDRPQRRKPKPRPIYTEIVRMGDVKIDVWQEGEWSVPFDHKTLSREAKVKFKKPENPEEERLEEREKLKKIRYLKNVVKRDGQVVVIEYWVPKEDYSRRNIVETLEFGETLRVRRKNGPEETGEVGYFGKRVKVVDYTFGGKWFRIADEDGDGVFEKKREISSPVSTAEPAPSADYGY